MLFFAYHKVSETVTTMMFGFLYLSPLRSEIQTQTLYYVKLVMLGIQIYHKLHLVINDQIR